MLFAHNMDYSALIEVSVEGSSTSKSRDICRVKADLESKENGTYEITMKGKKTPQIVSSLKKRLDPKKFKISSRGGRCFVDVL